MRPGNCSVLYLLLALFLHNAGFAQAVIPVTVFPQRQSNGKFCWIDKHTNKPVSEAAFDSVKPFQNGFAIAYTGKQPVVVNGKGQVVPTKTYNQIRPFSGQLAAVQKDGRWGFVNEAGREVIAPEYEAVKDFDRQEALVCRNDAWFRINKEGAYTRPYKATDSRPGPSSAVATAAPAFPNSLWANRAASTLPCPPNIDFENGNFSNWQTNVGTTSSIGTSNVVALPTGAWQNNVGTVDRHMLQDRNTTTPSTDRYGTFPVNPLNGGRFSVKLGTDGDLGLCGGTPCPNSRAEAIRYVVNVPANATDYSITFSYAVVLENPIDGVNLHKDYEQPRFTVKMYDPATAEVIPCANFTFVASGPLPGFDTSKSTKHPDAVVRTKKWSSVYVNLSKYPGKTFYLEFTTADCTRGGHFGYAYVDVIECGIAARAQTLCASPNITTLYGPPGFQSYQWYNSNYTASIGTTQDLVLTPSPPVGTQFWVIATPYPNTGCPACDCRDTVGVTVSVNYPVANAGPDQSVCGGSPVTIGTAPVAGYVYQWSPTTGLVSPNASSTIVNATAPVQYVLTVTDTGGCSVSDTVNVDVFPKPTAGFSVNNRQQCLQNNAFSFGNTSAGSGTVVYEWSFGDGSVSSQKDATHVYATAGTYDVTLTVTTDKGCSDVFSQRVTVLPAPVLSIAGGNSATICRGSGTQLQASGAATYAWTPAADLSCSACANPVALPLTTVTYYLEGSSAAGCKSRDSVRITVIQPFRVAIAGDTVCLGESIVLNASGAPTYLWTPSTGLSNPTIANPVASPAVTTTYRVVGSDGFNCFTDTAYATVTVAPKPTLSLGADQVLSTGTFFTLQSNVANGPITTWLWSPRTNLSCSTCPQPTAEVKTDITYTLRITNSFGCTTADTIAIKAFCAEGQVYIPNAFTPDGDGLNDVFMVQGRGIAVVKTFRIFNRWGELLFERTNVAPNDVRQGWDGKIRGIVGPPDVFVYTAEVVCSNGSSFFFKGNVTIIR